MSTRVLNRFPLEDSENPISKQVGFSSTFSTFHRKTYNIFQLYESTKCRTSNSR